MRVRDQTRPPCEYGANPFSGSRDISYTNKKVTDRAKNRTLRSSLRAVMMPASNFPWSWSVLSQSFIALTQLIGLREGHATRIKSAPLIAKASLPANRLNKVHLESVGQNGGSSGGD